MSNIPACGYHVEMPLSEAADRISRPWQYQPPDAAELRYDERWGHLLPTSIAEVNAMYDRGYGFAPICDNVDASGRCKGHHKEEL